MLRSFIASLERRLLRKISGNRPIRVQLDITNACNLACSHCYHSNHSDAGSLSLDDWLKILDQVNLFAAKYSFDAEFVICGGEPLASKKLQPVLERIEELWPDAAITIPTNGTIVNQKILKILKGKNIFLQVSLDGPDAARHDSVRGAGSFERSMAGIKAFQGEGLPVQILSILSHRTRPWIDDFFMNAKQLQVTNQNFTRLVSAGAGANLVQSGTDRPLQPLELKEAYSKIILSSAAAGVGTNTFQPLYTLIDPAFGSKGRFAQGDIVIDYKGQLKVSSRVNFIVGSVLNEGLENLYINNPTMKALQAGEINGCRDCRFFGVCGGDRNASFGAYGSFFEKDPGCWLN